jgi:hypothetical protein
MLLVLRKTDDAGTSNPYLADSAAIVVPVPQYEITTQPSPICQMAVNTPIGEDSIKRYTYSWYPSSYLGDATVTPTDFTYDYQSNPRPDGTLLTYFLSVTRPNGCVSRDTVFVQLKGIPSVKDIENVAVCHDRPFHISFTDDTNTDPLNPTTFEWTVNDVSNTGLPASGSTAYIDVEKLVNSGSAPVMASVTVTPNKGSCDGVSKTFTVKIRPQSLYNYPDLRIRACPDDGASIRLAKYIDTLDITGLEWSSPLANDGSIAADYIASSGVRTFTYTVNNPCLVSPITRKIYLETLKPNKMRPLRNNIMICYEKAEVVQINQIFGIEVGEGTWTYHALKSDNVTQQNISAYVTESHSAEYNGMVIMNGKAIYKDDNIDSYTYNGMKVKKVEFIYTPEAGSCLDGATYKIMIILTPKIN